MDQIRVANDGMVFAIYFTTDDAPQVMPPWAADLPQLGAVDSGQILPDDLLGNAYDSVADGSHGLPQRRLSQQPCPTPPGIHVFTLPFLRKSATPPAPSSACP